jgi:hypothetical protein
MEHSPETGTFAPSLTLNHEQLKALGLELPAAGTKLTLEAEAVVTHSSTEDPNADGDIDASHIELRLVELKVETDENPVDRRAKALSKVWKGPKKIAERDVGGTPEKGEFGAFNRRFGL